MNPNSKRFDALHAGQTPAVFRQHSYPETSHTSVDGTISSRGYKSAENLKPDGWRVRKLTPLECERLQGFPENWTNVWVPDFRRSAIHGKRYGSERIVIKRAADTPRYKALGNAWAVPVGKWVVDRVVKVLLGETL